MGGTYNLQIFKMRINIASSGKPRRWRPPTTRIRIPTTNITGDAGTREIPNTDSLASPFSGVHTAAGIVKPVPVGLGRIIFNTAACVVGLAGGIDVAVTCEEGAGEA